MARSVLLVHGFSTSARRTWVEPGWVDLLSEAGRTVIAPDLLGHGDADKPHDPDAYGRVEELVAEALPPEPVDAIGYSAGARIVLSLAAQNPGLFDRIVIGGVGGRLLKHREGNPILDAIEGRGGDDDMVANHFRSMAHDDGNDPAALAAFLRRDQPRLDAEHLASITNETLLVIGDQDFAGPGQPLADEMPNCDVVTLRGVDHFGLPKAFQFMDEAFRFIGADPMA